MVAVSAAPVVAASAAAPAPAAIEVEDEGVAVRLKTVSVPSGFEDVFAAAEHVVSRYFRERKDHPEHGTISPVGAGSRMGERRSRTSKTRMKLTTALMMSMRALASMVSGP